jgi:hypothetical protein
MPHTTITTLSKDGVKKKEQIQANTPSEAHRLIGRFLAKEFSGQLKVLEYYYLRGE